MKCSSYFQFTFVKADTLEKFERDLNAKLYELRTKDPEVVFDGLTAARIRYKESELTPEDLQEEYALKGVRLHCQDCPFFEPLRNKDGSVNRAAKKGDCPFKNYGLTWRDAQACERLFKMLNDGDVKIVKGGE